MADALRMDHSVIVTLRGAVRGVAEDTVTAVRQEVPSYAGPLSGAMGQNIEAAVQMALAGFLRLAERGIEVDPGTPLSPALEGAYSLGRGEARSGRSADALLSAYRVGARVAWRELADAAIANGAAAEDLAAFAELVFAYIDALSAASLAGHADELATTGRVRERYLDRLGRALLGRARPAVLVEAAERADWPAPATLTAVLLPQSQARSAYAALELAGFRAPWGLAGELPGVPDLSDDAGAGADDGLAVLLVADAHDRARERMLSALAGRAAVVGPARPWQQVRASYDRTLRARGLPSAEAMFDQGVLDADAHLATLVLTADPEALADLRARALAPLDACRPATREKLAETLRSWLLHQGRRDDVAGDLYVHPQTVRYRMGQLRELYGDSLDDPETLLTLTVALAAHA